MSFSLRSNFFANARGITFTDGGGVTWAFNASTNSVTATAAGGAGVGTVTSVGLADGSTTPIYSITGTNPVTTSGTLTFALKTQNANTVFAGPSTGSAAQPTFRALVLADIPTGYLYSNLSGAPSIPSGANPTATIGLAAVNGSATTFMRSDGAPALSVTITPTWTGEHTWNLNGGSTNAILVNTGAANQYCIKAVGNATSAESFGLLIEAGTTSADICAQFTSQSGATTYFNIRGDGAIAFHNAAPQAQSTGWGTPTGSSVVSNLVCGASASLTTTSEALGALIIYLKAIGLLGA